MSSDANVFKSSGSVKVISEFVRCRSVRNRNRNSLWIILKLGANQSVAPVVLIRGALPKAFGSLQIALEHTKGQKGAYFSNGKNYSGHTVHD